MSRKPVPTAGPPRPSSPLLWAHLWGCIIGRKTKFNPDAIQRMVDLREGGRSRRGASNIVEAELKGKEGELDAETLRKHFREKEAAGELPPPSSHIDSKAAAMVAAFEWRTRSTAEARQAIGAAEDKARSLGLNLDQDLENLTIRLIHTLAELRGFLNNDPESQMLHFLNQGVNDPAEAVRQLRQAQEQFELCEKQLEALQEVTKLRHRVRREP